MKIKLSKSQWEFIGRKTGWMKKAKYEVIDSNFNRSNYPDLIGKILDTPPAYANVKLVKDEKHSLNDIFMSQSKMFEEEGTEDAIEDFIRKSLKEGYEAKEIIQGINKFYHQSEEVANNIFNRIIMKLKGIKQPNDKDVK